MKNPFLTLTCVLAMGGAAFAQSSLSTDQPNYNIMESSGSFNVTINLTTTAPDISSFDLFLQSNSAGANAFSITAVTPVFAAVDFGSYADSPHTGPFATDPSFPGATYVTTHDSGFGYTQDEPISGTVSLETLTISYSFGSTPAPGTVFTFSTTPSGTADSPAYKGTFFYQGENSGFAFTPINDPATFTATFTAVPEPSTCFAGIAALGVIGYTMLRRRQIA
jgi:PEP-CTERM motif